MLRDSIRGRSEAPMPLKPCVSFRETSLDRRYGPVQSQSEKNQSLECEDLFRRDRPRVLSRSSNTRTFRNFGSRFGKH